MMITKEQVIPKLLKACPSFQKTWDDSDNHDLLYPAMGELAHHLLDLYKTGRSDEFALLYEAIESFHVDGDDYVKELATIGILEGIQNVWKNNGANPDDFGQHLPPVSMEYWHKLNAFWSNQSAQQEG